MLARRPIPEHHDAWNRRWGAPQGRVFYRAARRCKQGLRARYWCPRLSGMFAYQVNNTIREAEYPWAFFATDLERGMRAVEVGGGLSGFQFVLSRVGLEVVNVDPGEEATGVGWPVGHRQVERLNRVFRTDVRLISSTIEQAGLEDNTVDRVFSISVVEHMRESERSEALPEIARILKPGGMFVATVDLFLNLMPFCSRRQNRFGDNADVGRMIEQSGLELVTGDPGELYGCSRFSADRVLCNLENYFLGRYPALSQLMVLRKASASRFK